MKPYLSDAYGRFVQLKVRDGKAEFLFWQQEHNGQRLFWDLKDRHDWKVEEGCLEGRKERT